MDAPTIGDLVMFKHERTEDWEPRAEQGQFICNDDGCPNAAMVLVKRNGRENLVRTYCPRLLDWPKQRWKVHRNEGDDSSVWVSSSGNVRWEPPPDEDILTLEERSIGLEGHEEPNIEAFGDTSVCCWC